ncbi:MAG: DUF3006 domain-containing protein [Candidatus Margulisiibacteriota bacterium]
MKAEKKFKALLDRIEGEKGVVLLGEEEREAVDFPKSFLPEGTKEGDILTFKIKLESRRTKEAKAKVAEMIKKLSTS